jgi:hypothetical protein
MCASRSTASWIASELEVDHAGRPVIPAGREVGSRRRGDGRAGGKGARDGPAALFKNFGCIKLGATEMSYSSFSRVVSEQQVTHDPIRSEHSLSAGGQRIENP